jgi:hypothetical protein
MCEVSINNDMINLLLQVHDNHLLPSPKILKGHRLAIEGHACPWIDIIFGESRLVDHETSRIKVLQARASVMLKARFLLVHSPHPGCS